MMTITFKFFRLVFLLILMIGCANAQATDNEQTGMEIAAIFSSGTLPEAAKSIESQYEAIRAYYESRTFKPVWVRDTGPKGKGKALFEEIKRSVVHGLSPEFYHADRISELIGSDDPKNLSALDLLLTDALLRFGANLRNGYVGPDRLPSQTRVQPVKLGAEAIIRGAADAGNLRDYAGELLQVDDRYFRLISKLAEFLRIEKAGYWPQLTGTAFPDVSNANSIAPVRRLLALTGDLPPTMMENATPSALKRAISRYQERHGILQSGEIDDETYRSMAVPLSYWIKQIQSNLERRRWQNQELGSDHIYINLADHRARLVRNNETEAFLDLEETADLASLPAFYGNVTGVKFGSNGSKIVELEVEPQWTGTEPFSPGSIPLKVLSPHALRHLLGSEDAPTEAKAGEFVALEKPLSIFVTYLTAWANRDGTLHFRDDVYNREPELLRLLSLE